MAKQNNEDNNVTDSAANKWQQMEEADQAAVDEQQERLKASIADRSRESLENELVDLRTKVQESKDYALRIQAEMQNLRRRTEQDIDKAYKFANEKLAGELLPVFDSLTRGVESIVEEGPAKEGMKLTLNMLKDVMARHGVSEINPAVGDAFNPQCHEAMAMTSVEGANANTVAAVMQIGFELNGRVLRAAMVAVAK